MVRAFGLVTFLFAAIAIVGCQSKPAPPATTAPPAESTPVAGLSPNSEPEITFFEPSETPLDPNELTVETLELTEAPGMAAELHDETATTEWSSAGGKIGVGLGARGSGMREAIRGYGGSKSYSADLRARDYTNGDKFANFGDNEFHAVKKSPLSTFSVDVDTASYTKARSMLLERRQLPLVDAVRIEELINYFDYSYAGPKDEHPFAVHLETAACPWEPKHRLVRCALQGRPLEGKRPPANLVFLIDVSGSMDQANKLPLVQRALGMLVGQLSETDKVSIVVYAGSSGCVLPATPGNERAKILTAVQELRASGGTNGGQGIQNAYQLAQENFVKGGTNRVILCTDGDFNVGVTNTQELVDLAVKESQGGVFLSVLGFGTGNLNDVLLKQLSTKANGNYEFIDSDLEARKVFVQQAAGTLVTIAKDVKIQVEFNPAQVAAYRLIGYENRQLAHRDFNNDKKDAGDIGAGHRVTAFYEIVPTGVDSEFTSPEIDDLKYQAEVERAEPAQKLELTPAAKSGELLTLKLRYQPPAGGKSTLLSFPVKDNGQGFSKASSDFQFAAAVASFGMLLRDSKFKGNSNYGAVIEIASACTGEDKQGQRNEFLQMVTAAQALSRP
ncbi:vWA domain-containing protein [Anatilimnocola floriformis]|uniref:vWA domain-containing protein n=1 Tax=Anatilimnocola floriformis TaxID=2948575 RepID=UPI0020C491FA|nr:VWA domain-containing protein [Anatilimnocola floriformis]